MYLSAFSQSKCGKVEKKVVARNESVGADWRLRIWQTRNKAKQFDSFKTVSYGKRNALNHCGLDKSTVYSDFIWL